MRLLKNIYHFFFFLFKPSYWFMNFPYSREWDEELLIMMDRHNFEPIYYEYLKQLNEHYVHLDDQEIWIRNHPYASFAKSTSKKTLMLDGPPRVRPSRMTIYKARKKLIEDMNDW